MSLPRNHLFIFSILKNNYNRAVLLTARRWEKLARRVSDNYGKLAFLHSCIRENLPPRSLRRKPAVDSAECRQALRRFQHRTMRALINDLHRRIDSLRSNILNHREHCRRELANRHFFMLDRHVRFTTRSTSQRVTEKFQHRTERLRGLSNCNSPEGLVHNFSSKVLTHPQVALLQRDAGCNLMDAHALDFVAALEPIIHHIGAEEEEVKSSIQQQVTGLLMNHRGYRTLSRDEVEALNQLKKDDTILIVPADKGRATVIMDKAQYVSKALCLLKDTTAYRVVEGDPMTALKNHTNKVLNTLKRSKRLDDTILRKLRPSDTAMPRFYGLPKVHKEGVPLRPIVSFNNTPTSSLAKWLSIRISHLVDGSSTTVKSAEEFLDRIRPVRIEDDEVMVSFDVVSLFTSIPQDLAVKTVRELLEQRGLGQQQDSLRPQDLVNLLEICLKTYFTFQNTTFEQVKGTPMGSPISSIVAEAVLQQLEHVAMAQCRPKVWARYVDDTFAIIKRSQKADFVDTLNSVCVDLQFTEEEEHQGKLAFLDVLVHRQPDGTLRTQVYRKPTHTDRILHYDSNHPVSHKVSCIKTLFKRVDSHCSTAKARIEERKHLLKVCRRNGYPMKFIRRHSRPLRSPVRFQMEELTPQITRVTLPYISNVSEATTRLLAPYNVRVAHNPNQTLRSKVMRPKDPLPITERSGVVYKINCKDCPANYVGETSKRVRTRIHEHKLAVRRGDQYSQIGAHMLESGHRFDFDNVQVMANDNTKGGRLLKEAWLSNNESINRHIDLCPAHITLRTWARNSQSPGKKQFNTATCPLGAGLVERKSPKNARIENSLLLSNSLRAEACADSQQVDKRINSCEPTASESEVSSCRMNNCVMTRSRTSTRTRDNREGKDRNIASTPASSSAINPIHDGILTTWAPPDNVNEPWEGEEEIAPNVATPTRPRKHLRRGIPPGNRQGVRNQELKNPPPSLPLKTFTHPQGMERSTSRGEGMTPTLKILCEGGSDSQAKNVTNPDGIVGNAPIDKKMKVSEVTSENGSHDKATAMEAGYVGESNEVIITNKDYGKREGGRGSSRKEDEENKQLKRASSPNPRPHEKKKDGNVGTKESKKTTIGNTETRIKVQMDWRGPVTRSMSRAQRTSQP